MFYLLIQFDFALMRLLFPQSQNNLKFIEQFLHSLLKRIKKLRVHIISENLLF